MNKYDDAISRQAVLDLVCADWKYEGLEQDIESLPSVTPQPKEGKKYKLTLLKDLPTHKAGTVVLNISQDELDGKKDYYYRHYDAPEQNLSDIYDLRFNTEWVKIEEDNRCDCLTKSSIDIRRQTVGYGRDLIVKLSFVNKEIYTYYEHACDSGTSKSLPINYCPLCGREI